MEFNLQAQNALLRGASEGRIMKNAVAIRHIAFEDAGTLAGVLEHRGFAINYLEAGVDDLSPAKSAACSSCLEDRSASTRSTATHS